MERMNNGVSAIINNINNYNSISYQQQQQQPPPVTMKWDPKNLEIRTHSVEKTLEPLVMQVRFRLDKFYCFNSCDC